MKNYLLKDFLRESTSKRSAKHLSGAIGDGFLFAENPLFREVRVRALALGFRFSDKPAFDYFEWPILALADILSKKTIPYRRNLSALENVEKKKPRAFTLATIFRTPPAKNHVLHESAHVIADAVFTAHFRKGQIQKSTGVDDRIIRSFFAEACANAVDLSAYLFSTTREHSAALFFNSYFYPTPNTGRALVNAGNSIGASKLVALIALFYLYSNYSEAVNDTHIAKLFALVEKEVRLSTELKKSLRVLAAEAAELNPVFRKHTTEFYLNYIGIDGDIGKLTSLGKTTIDKVSEKLAPAFLDFAKLSLGER